MHNCSHFLNTESRFQIPINSLQDPEGWVLINVTRFAGYSSRP